MNDEFDDLTKPSPSFLCTVTPPARAPAHPPRSGGRRPCRRPSRWSGAGGGSRSTSSSSPRTARRTRRCWPTAHDRADRPRVAPPARVPRRPDGGAQPKRQFDQDRDQLRRAARSAAAYAEAADRLGGPEAFSTAALTKINELAMAHLFPEQPEPDGAARAGGAPPSRVRAPAPRSPRSRSRSSTSWPARSTRPWPHAGGSSSSAPRSPSSATASNSAKNPTATTIVNRVRAAFGMPPIEEAGSYEDDEAVHRGDAESAETNPTDSRNPGADAVGWASPTSAASIPGRAGAVGDAHPTNSVVPPDRKDVARPTARRTSRVCFGTPLCVRGVLKHTLHNSSRYELRRPTARVSALSASLR